MPTVLRLVYSRFAENPSNKLEVDDDDSQSVEFIQDVPDTSAEYQTCHFIERPDDHV